jgi:hypothetical protein
VGSPTVPREQRSRSASDEDQDCRGRGQEHHAHEDHERHSLHRLAGPPSNGLEHGSKDMPYIRTASTAVTPKLFGYVRKGILDLLNLDPQVRDRLAAMSPVDITPFQHSIIGVFTGDVADPAKLGPSGEPYPWLDWEIPIDDVTVLPDGRVEVKPSYTITPQLAPDVHFTPFGWRVAVGLNDPAEFATPVTEGEHQEADPPQATDP